MAQHTKHPVAPPPTAPERESTGHLMLRAYITFTLVLVFAHVAVYNLVGIPGAAVTMGIFLLATLAIGIPMLAKNHPQPFRWRRLPWAALGYATFAIVSIAWSGWREATLMTWLLFAAVTINGLFIAHVLTWPEVVRALASAFKWILGLSLALELWVSLVMRKGLLPNFLTLPDGEIDPQWYWVRGNLFNGGRLQGIVGNANLLAIISLFALITFGVLFAAKARWRPTLALWALLAAYFVLRTRSAGVFAASAAAFAVLIVALLVRRASTPRARARIYVVSAGIAALAVVSAWLFSGQLLELLGRKSDLTGRSDNIWIKVLERAAEHPIFGNGFSSPWVPTDPAFANWIIDHGITVFHAHNMWLDVLMQLGVVGLVLMAIAYLSLVWRSWFFAVDRPRWDLDATRQYSPLTLLPILLTVPLLVQGLTESTPIMLWGWLLLILLSFKVKSVPLIGIGERDDVREQRTRRVP